MIKIVVTCDKCKKQIKDPIEDTFFHVTIREKYFKPDGSIYTIDQYDMTLCDECEAMLHEGKEKEKTEAAVPEKKPAKEKPEAAVENEKVAPVQPEVKESKAKRVDPTLVKVLLNKGWNQAKIAKEMDVTPAAISQAVKRIEGKEL